MTALKDADGAEINNLQAVSHVGYNASKSFTSWSSRDIPLMMAIAEHRAENNESRKSYLKNKVDMIQEVSRQCTKN